jgi:threonine synthase
LKYILRCITCSREFDSNPRASTCPNCGSYKGTLDVIYPIYNLKSELPRDLDQYRNLSVFDSFYGILPNSDIYNLPQLPFGDTPFFQSAALSRLTGMPELWIKDDSRNPSASLKDRASAVAIAMAKEAGASVIAVASTGNAASSLATLAAASSMKAVLFVPQNAPRPKLAQILIHGGHVIRLNCDYDNAFDLCQMACEKFGWYNRNTAVNPFTGEGKKTVALEIARDLAMSPDVVICPVGDGCIIGGIYKAFSDLLGLELIDHLPRLYGVQFEGSNLVKAFETNIEIEPLTNVKTIADSIAVGYPRDGMKALRAVRNTGGAMIAVSDESILEAQRILASKAGIFAEPAASASYAGLINLLEKGLIKKDETTVILITGHGLKDIDVVLKNIKLDMEPIEPTLETILLSLNNSLT